MQRPKESRYTLVVDPHRRAEERSIALHAEVVRRLRQDPAVLERARLRLEDWRRTRMVHPFWVERWAEVLSLPLEQLCAQLVDPGEAARALRQSTPFAGALDSATRWRIWREVGERLG